MSNIEKVRAEIKRISSRAINEDGQDICEYLLSLIDSLSNEEPSKDLEEATARYERENRESILSSVDIVDAFKAGAEWQGEQMMEDAVEGEVCESEHGLRDIVLQTEPFQNVLKGFKEGDKVKIIIVKQ